MRAGAVRTRPFIVSPLTCLLQHISTTHEIYLKCEVNLPLENALSKLRPQTEANMDVFREVERLIHEVRWVCTQHGPFD